MVMFSFKPQFVLPIELGIKRQTIRRLRKRNARPGDGLQLYTGPRMRPRKVGDADCIDAGPIHISLREDHVDANLSVGGGLCAMTESELDDFAKADGFEDWDGLKAFWRTTHGLDDFHGWLTQWGDTFRGGVSAVR